MSIENAQWLQGWILIQSYRTSITIGAGQAWLEMTVAMLTGSLTKIDSTSSTREDWEKGWEEQDERGGAAKRRGG